MIPKIIHTYYFSKKDDMPTSMSSWLDDLHEKYPDFEIKLWTLNESTSCYKIEHKKYIDDCLNSGKIGYLYLSYYVRFYKIMNFGGFWIEPETEIQYDLNQYLYNDFVFDVFGIEDINVDFFGAKISSNYNEILALILNEFENKRFINQNNSLNIFNPCQFVGKVFHKYDYEFYINKYEEYNDQFIKNIYINFLLENKKNEDSSYKRSVYQLPKKHTPKASIVIPIYNSAQYLKECMDSIFNQTEQNFEIICINDGSTDNSEEIIKSYNDDRIIFINKKHSGIVDSLNMGIKRAQGDYIIRHDSDDIMLPHRISYQLKFMENNHDIDILSNGFRWWTPGIEDDNYYSNNIGCINMEQMLCGNVMAHPCICIKRKSLKDLPNLYEEYYKYAEDYKLWFTALSHGLKLYSDAEIVTWYRCHENQTTREKYNDLWRSSKMIIQAYDKSNINNNKNKITCIIPFQNEGKEIERTVASIRATSHTNILLINDCSTDGYDYEKVAKIFGCDYIKNDHNLGVAGSRDKGVSICQTEYFLLLDGHMRFYDLDWDIRLLEELKKNEKSIITSNTLVLSHDIFTDIYENEYNFNYGPIKTRAANVNDWEDGWLFTGKWTNTEFPGFEDQNIVPISCCMGAVYACNKTWWKHIGGLQGLEKWGQDEPYISIKSWLAGGNVLLIKDWGVGHLYRNESAYLVPNKQRLKNRVFLTYFFLKDETLLRGTLMEYKALVGEESYIESINEFCKDSERLLGFKRHFWEQVAVHELDWYWKEINNKVKTFEQFKKEGQ